MNGSMFCASFNLNKIKFAEVMPYCVGSKKTIQTDGSTTIIWNKDFL